MNRIILTCPVHQASTRLYGLTVLDDNTRCWLNAITASISCRLPWSGCLSKRWSRRLKLTNLFNWLTITYIVWKTWISIKHVPWHSSFIIVKIFRSPLNKFRSFKYNMICIVLSSYQLSSEKDCLVTIYSWFFTESWSFFNTLHLENGKPSHALKMEIFFNQKNSNNVFHFCSVIHMQHWTSFSSTESLVNQHNPMMF